MPQPAQSETETPTSPFVWGEFQVPSLAGVHGRIRFAGPLGHVHAEIDDGRVRLSPSDGSEEVDCEITSEIEYELVRLVRGEINLVTAMLQGLVSARGDLMLAVRVAGSMPALGAHQRARVERADRPG